MFIVNLINKCRRSQQRLRVDIAALNVQRDDVADALTAKNEQLMRVRRAERFLWLRLMTCGLSHRRVLRIVREVEHGQ